MINNEPCNAIIPPPPTEIPEWVWSKKFDSKPQRIKSSKLIETIIEEFYYPSKEAALKATKMAVKRKPEMHFGSMADGKGFNVYLDGKVVVRHLIQEGEASHKTKKFAGNSI